VLAPGFVLLADEQLTGAARDRVQTRLAAWLKQHIETLLKPLFDLRNASELPGLPRGIAFRIAEALGVVERPAISEEVKGLDQAARAGLRSLGVRFGAYHLFVPALLKPAPSRLLAELWALKHASLDVPGLLEVPQLSASGRTSIPVDPAVPVDLYRVCGFKACGGRAVRIDILERLADLIRPILAWRPGPEAGPMPDGAHPAGGFMSTVRMTSLVGCSGEDFASILRGLGYRMDRRPLPAPVAVEAAAAPDAAAETATDPATASAGQADAAVAVDAVAETTAAEAPAAGEAATGETAPAEAAGEETAEAGATGALAAPEVPATDVSATEVSAGEVAADEVAASAADAGGTLGADVAAAPAAGDETAPDGAAPADTTPDAAPDAVAADGAAGEDSGATGAVVAGAGDAEGVAVEAAGAEAVAGEAAAEPALVEVWRPGRTERRGDARPRPERQRDRRNDRGGRSGQRGPRPADAPAAAGGEPRTAEAAAGERRGQRRHDRPGDRPNDRPNDRRGDRPRDDERRGRPAHGRADDRRDDRRDDRPRDDRSRDGGRGRQTIDPNSPFAALAALKADLERRSKER